MLATFSPTKTKNDCELQSQNAVTIHIKNMSLLWSHFSQFYDLVDAFFLCRLESEFQRSFMCLRNWCLTGPVVIFTQHRSVSRHPFLVIISLSNSQAGLGVDGDSRERSVRAEEWLALGLSFNRWFLGLRLDGTLAFLYDFLQQEHISISPLSVFTCAQRRFTQDLLYGLQIGLLSLK